MRCCSTTARSGFASSRQATSASTAEVMTSGLSAAARASACPIPMLPFGAMTEKDRTDLEAALMSPASTGSRSPSCSARRTSPRSRKIARGRVRDHGQDREAAGARASRRDHRPCRRAHGGARRSRRGNAAREGARPAEADHARRAQRRQAGGGRDPDARIDDFTRRCRPAPRSPTSPPPCSRAPMRSCCRPNWPSASTRSRPLRPWIGSRSRSSAIRSTTRIIHAQRIGPEATGADAISAAARTDRRDAQSRGHRLLHGLRRDEPARGPRAPAARRSSRSRRFPPRGAGLRSSGAFIACSPTTPAISTTWSPRPAASPTRRASRYPASGSSSSAGVPLGTPGATNMLRIAFVGDDTDI